MCKVHRSYLWTILVVLAFLYGISGPSGLHGQECTSNGRTATWGSPSRERFIDFEEMKKGLSLDNTPTGKKLRAQKIRFLMREDSNSSWINIGESGREIGDKWKNASEVKVLIHGWTPWLNESPEQKISYSQLEYVYDAYQLSDDNVNLIMVDWTELSTYTPMLYWQAADSIRYAAEKITTVICRLKAKEMITDYQNLHIIGFSLGAHLAGAIGQRLHLRTRKQVGRITGLDPAGPLFTNGFGSLPVNLVNVLDSTDAAFVEVIHCNMPESFPILPHQKGFGTNARSGHVDFFPNGGRTQSGCSPKKNDDGCSHNACPHLFVESIHENILACKCESWAKFVAGLCPCDESSSDGAWFGDRTNTSAKGTYYLRI